MSGMPATTAKKNETSRKPRSGSTKAIWNSESTHARGLPSEVSTER
jgi:hypothetical protein